MRSKPFPSTRRLLAPVALLAAAALAPHAVAQNRPTAITNARIVTMEGKTIPLGTVLIRNGAIQEAGAKVRVPAGAKIIDAKGGTIMPGLVSAYSRVGLGGGRSSAPSMFGRGRRGFRGFRSSRSSSGPGRNSAATKVAQAIYARQPVFHQLLAAGVTTAALTPTGSGFPGQGAILNLTGKTRDELILDDTAFLSVNPSASTKAKKLLKDTFDKAKKLVAERKKPKAAPKKPETKKDPKAAAKPPAKGSKKAATPPKPAPKPGPKPGPKPTPKPGPKPAPKPAPKDTKKPAPKAAKAAPKKPAKKKDPNLEVLADLLEGKRRAFLGLASAADMIHYLDAVGDLKFNAAIVAAGSGRNRGSLTLVKDHIKKLEARVLMRPSLGTVPYTDHITNPAAELHDAGIEIGFILSDGRTAGRRTFQALMELVRHGLDAEAALKAVTLIPARMLGVDKRVGSIKSGKDANLILFSGDPLDPTTTLKHVWFEGNLVEKDTER